MLQNRVVVVSKKPLGLHTSAAWRPIMHPWVFSSMCAVLELIQLPTDSTQSGFKCEVLSSSVDLIGFQGKPQRNKQVHYSPSAEQFAQISLHQ